MCTTEHPAISYPPDLPISQRREELLKIISENQVVVVAGETGSGKSTQIPKMCLELGRGIDGLIGHTQPRRIAARSIAERVAEELKDSVGGRVGYKVRFTDEVSARTQLKLMTDGVLLAEIQRDRKLSKYDTIIVDEAHERSLNVDFLLGYLKQLLPRRPDLKLIITSATIDTERFSQHFDDAPIMEVSGRTFPVEIRYQPLDGDERDVEVDQPQAIAEAVEELFTEGDGDVLVFCSGEREIRDAADELAELNLPGTEILPLYARLSAAEQHRVFSSHRGRRVVLSTNVAETSLTVPGIRYVVDAGTARISRYNRRTKVQRLPIEEISQASANQRSGRCGRVGPGIAIRLYAEDEFNDRPEFTEPEIQRTNLASVILQMAALGLGDIEAFPFVDPPDSRNIRDGIALLEELGAVDPERVGTKKWLTPMGRKIARLPVDPRLGRMVIAGADGACLSEMLIIASALSVQDPRDRPKDQQSQARELHKRFDHEGSDFLTLVNLWKHLKQSRSEMTSSKFRRTCKQEFINYRRVREWQDVHQQLRRVANEIGLRANQTEADPDSVHKALLAGLLSHVGLKDPETHEYRGARGSRFAIAPGSVLFKKSPKWVMAGELVETNRMWARAITAVRPDWIESAGAHLIRRNYGEPSWDSERGLAMVNESVMLYGIPLVAGRRVPYQRANPSDARDMFIHHALVAGDWDTQHKFMGRNMARFAEVRELEARTRQPDLLVDDLALFHFFDERVGPDVTSARHFDKWWKQAQRDDPHLLDLAVDELIDPRAGHIDETLYPVEWVHGDLHLPLSYEFDPASSDDGLTIEVQASALDRINPSLFEWNVPGNRVELVTALIRTLPKQHRKQFVPIPDTARTIVERIDPTEIGLVEGLLSELSRIAGSPIPADSFTLEDLPAHLRPSYRVVDDDGRMLAEGANLGALRVELRDLVRAQLSTSGHELERRGMTSFDVDRIPTTVDTSGQGHQAVAYPALVDEGASVALRLLATPAEQADAMWEGTRRLLLLNLPSQLKAVRHLLTNELKLALLSSPYAAPGDWYTDCRQCALDSILVAEGGPAWTASDFAKLLAIVRDALHDELVTVAERSAELLITSARLASGLLDAQQQFGPAAADMRGQLGALVYPSFLTSVGAERLPDIVRYVQGIARRLDRLRTNVNRDRQSMVRIQRLEDRYVTLTERLPWSTGMEDIGWMLQELRISLFAESLGTKGSVSEKRVEKAMDGVLRI
ncbi:MAG: ATP-dependent helicase HrpA [Candidatus Poriferisodalaceae bacterium]|jgi:ATP-dependent helicase HrpA